MKTLGLRAENLASTDRFYACRTHRHISSVSAPRNQNCSDDTGPLTAVPMPTTHRWACPQSTGHSTWQLPGMAALGTNVHVAAGLVGHLPACGSASGEPVKRKKAGACSDCSRRVQGARGRQTNRQGVGRALEGINHV